VTELVSLFIGGALLVLVIGFYSIIVTRNLMRALIGIEVLGKAATLLIILAGNATGRIALAQALAITMIIIEVAMAVVAVGIILCVFRTHGAIDARLLKDIKG
jgi:NADH:ubiquinone oxidoreductase subunit K